MTTVDIKNGYHHLTLDERKNYENAIQKLAGIIGYDSMMITVTNTKINLDALNRAINTIQLTKTLAMADIARKMLYS